MFLWRNNIVLSLIPLSCLKHFHQIEEMKAGLVTTNVNTLRQFIL